MERDEEFRKRNGGLIRSRKEKESRVTNVRLDFGVRVSEGDDFSHMNYPGGVRTVGKVSKTVGVRQSKDSFAQGNKMMQKIMMERLPMIKKEIDKKKYELAKSIQSSSLDLQRDNFRPIDDERVCNLQYLVNRLDASHKRSKMSETVNEPMRGYQNLSPNRLKQYIEMFKKKIKIVPQAIYVSKKRIALPKNSLSRKEESYVKKIRMIESRSEKKIAISRKQLIESRKSSRKSVSRKSVSWKSLSRKQLSRKDNKGEKGGIVK